MLVDWYMKQLCPYGIGNTEDGCHPDEAKALKEYLNMQTTANEAALSITRPVATSEDPDANVYRLWGFLSDALMDGSASDVTMIITLLRAIQDLANSEPISAAAPLWPHLRWFGSGWGDVYRKMDWRDNLEYRKPENQNTWVQQHVRLAKVEALLATNQLASIPLSWGLLDICDALESSKAVLHVEIPKVAEWFAIAGSHIRNAASTGAAVWQTAVQRDLWQDGGVLSMERWAFWRKRVESIKTSGQDELTQCAAEHILEHLRVDHVN